MLNINYGHNKKLMEKCRRLEEYAIFVAKLREYAKIFPDRLDIAITKAIDDCIDEGILKDFLIECKSEVLEMVLYSFDKELYEKDLKQIAFEEGEQMGQLNKLVTLVQKKLQKVGYVNIPTFTGETDEDERDVVLNGWKDNEYDVVLAKGLASLVPEEVADSAVDSAVASDAE